MKVTIERAENGWIISCLQNLAPGLDNINNFAFVIENRSNSAKTFQALVRELQDLFEEHPTPIEQEQFYAVVAPKASSEAFTDEHYKIIFNEEGDK